VIVQDLRWESVITGSLITVGIGSIGLNWMLWLLCRSNESS
jgi:hypothetical protein